MIWYEVVTNNVKLASHACFDEGMNDLPIDAILPNVQHLQRVDDGLPFDMDPSETITEDFKFFIHLFADLTVKTMLTDSTDDPTYELALQNCGLLHRAYVSDIQSNSCASRLYTNLKLSRRRLKGAYITTVSGNRVFTKQDVLSQLATLHDQGVQSVALTFAIKAKQSTAKI